MHKDIIEEQKLVCEQYGSAYRAVNDQDVIAIAVQSLTEESIVGIRNLPDSDGIAWFIYGGELDDADDFFHTITVKELEEVFPEALPFLALDTGYRFLIDHDEYEDVWREGESDI
ncbi:hypothetical protein [Acinetobacter sp. B51(2017)]|uniref:immunity protein Imm33 domain-containing protein n=1 Tax=Acinetobacter sp. B51(2017) TaxID=2060938 RepID=UPI000F08D936|nr:hypothetical protein [Acinetobacter sp. B51(2017)]